MRLFLSSEAVSEEQSQAFSNLVGKSPASIKMALIENAADVYAEGKRGWVYEKRAAMSRKFKVDLIDLRKFNGRQEELRAHLEESDVIWLGGGNIYYLRWILKETGADTIIRALVERDKVYGGGSAGAIVAGPTLKYFELADDPQKAPQVMYGGLALTDIVVIPHWARPDRYGSIVKEAEEKLQQAGYKTIHITDEQALILNGSAQTIIP